MSGIPGRPLKATWNRWLAVLVCCVVSLTTPFDLDTVAQVLDGSLSASVPSWTLTSDDSDDSDDLVRPGRAPECHRDVRKQPRVAGASALPRPGRVLRCRPWTQPQGRLTTRPGGEHAFRNGCGTPLLC
jgi:hypothetical protein